VTVPIAEQREKLAARLASMVSRHIYEAFLRESSERPVDYLTGALGLKARYEVDIDLSSEEVRKALEE
jgi:hypothetical protein